MQILKTIRDEDLGFNTKNPPSYYDRKGARAVIFDKDNNVALLNAKNRHYHKLPGGGLEEGEDAMQALKREALEEIGCEISNIKELGIIEMYLNDESQHSISYCFTADTIGEKREPHFEQDEIDDGFEPVWLSLDDAIKTLESEDGIKHYWGKFIQTRDLYLLKEARKVRG